MQHCREEDYINYFTSTLRKIIYDPFNLPIGNPTLKKVWISKIYNIDKAEFDRQWNNLVYYIADSRPVNIVEHKLFGTIIQGTDYDIRNEVFGSSVVAHRCKEQSKIISERELLLKPSNNPYVNTVVQFLPRFIDPDTTIWRLPSLKKAAYNNMLIAMIENI